jgi:hypothetical protein
LTVLKHLCSPKVDAFLEAQVVLEILGAPTEVGTEMVELLERGVCTHDSVNDIFRIFEETVETPGEKVFPFGWSKNKLEKIENLKIRRKSLFPHNHYIGRM